ncbi:hypothetical protein DPMN_175308 [Dreissena polymorpha]|uniref:Uncharacterized protein n=1 Tax=Dreissena polymorpha TaxID=45954 RepID=A0A9D4E4Z1_DREPO|nr:hypothetical protein DPMN_175308 [Dreissena polymorpha]
MPKGGEREVSGIIRENALSIEADQSCSPTIPPRQYKSADIVSQSATSDRQHPPETEMISKDTGRHLGKMHQDFPPSAPPRPMPSRQTSFHGDGSSIKLKRCHFPEYHQV